MALGEVVSGFFAVAILANDKSWFVLGSGDAVMYCLCNNLSQSFDGLSATTLTGKAFESEENPGVSLCTRVIALVLV